MPIRNIRWRRPVVLQLTHNTIRKHYNKTQLSLILARFGRSADEIMDELGVSRSLAKQALRIARDFFPEDAALLANATVDVI